MYQYNEKGGRTKEMKKHLLDENRRRSIAETTHSVIKRKRGSFVQ